MDVGFYSRLILSLAFHMVHSRLLHTNANPRIENFAVYFELKVFLCNYYDSDCSQRYLITTVVMTSFRRICSFVFFLKIFLRSVQVLLLFVIVC